MKKQWKIMMVLMGCAGMANAAYVTIGNAGNANDTTGYGGVSYEYNISVTEVTIAEFQAYRTATGTTGNENYWNDGVDGRSAGTGAPAVNVSLYEAMKYCNYLTTGNINSGYYSHSGGGVYVANVLTHAAYAAANGSTYFVPTEDEWYKAAYYDAFGVNGYSLYANGSNDAGDLTQGTTSGWNYWDGDYAVGYPNFMWESGDGGAEQNGTYDMMGNSFEWTEDSAGVLRGAGYGNQDISLASTFRPSGFSLWNEGTDLGFRPTQIGVVPEPATVGMLALSGLLIAVYRRFFGRV